jgi:hypothetical protein
MIDWQSLFLNSLWIVGLAILLAGFSYHYWLALETQQRVRLVWQRPSWQRFAWLGLAFFAAGLAGTSPRWWETVIWIIFLLYSTVHFLLSWRQRPAMHQPGDDA